MPKRIYVGNLPFDASPHDVESYFRGNAHFIDKVEVRQHTVSKTAAACIWLGDGMPNTVVEALHGREVDGRRLVAGSDKSILVNHEEDWWP
ncbi:MAG: hypothetical protein AAF567_06990 [Actinomycetota bacterium]